MADRVTLMVAVPLIFRRGIRKILKLEQDIKIIAETTCHLKIIPFVKQRKPDVLFLDTAISHLGKILESIEEKSPGTKVLLLLRAWNEEVIINVISLGVRGCLTDVSNTEQLIKAIKTIGRVRFGQKEIL